MSEQFQKDGVEGLSNQQLAQLVRATASADYYSLLALLFQRPGKALIEGIKEGSLSHDYEELTSELAIEKTQVEGIISRAAEFEKLVTCERIALSDLRAAYTRLFRHPKLLLVPPYEGLFLDSELIAAGKKSTDALLFVNPASTDSLSMYQEAGLKRTDETAIPSDCITVQLEFMGFLYGQKARCILEKADECVQNQVSDMLLAFKQKHVVTWMPTFFKRCQEQGQETIYALAGDMGSVLMEYEGASCCSKPLPLT